MLEKYYVVNQKSMLLDGTGKKCFTFYVEDGVKSKVRKVINKDKTITYYFGKNKLGLTDEFEFIYKEILEYSQTKYVIIKFQTKCYLQISGYTNE